MPPLCPMGSQVSRSHSDSRGLPGLEDNFPYDICPTQSSHLPKAVLKFLPELIKVEIPRKLWGSLKRLSDRSALC